MHEQSRDTAQMFFIVGCPRSGTTLLRWMLDSHANVAVTPETHFGERYVKRHRRHIGRGPGHGDDRDDTGNGDRDETRRRLSILDEFCGSAGFREMSLDESRYRDRAAGNPDEIWWPLKVALQDFARLKKAGFVGEKTPSHALYLPALAKAFPDAKFLLVRRDPRAVVASWRRVSWRKQTDVEVAEIWRRYCGAMRAAESTMGDRCLALSFENLVTATSASLRIVCTFLGTDFDPKMLCYFERGRAEASVEAQRDDSMTFEAPAASRVSAWRGDIKPHDLQRIETVCAREMRQSGYPLESTRLERWTAAPSVLRQLLRKRAKRRLRAR